MGGLGSGKWIRANSKKTVESQNQLDIRWLRKQGYLKTGISGKLSWIFENETAGAIEYFVKSDRIILLYNYYKKSGVKETVEQHLLLSETRCNYGGSRFFFICPCCLRKADLLYGADKYFLCRRCYKLTYSSQQENVKKRMMRKARELRSQVGGGINLLESFPEKPKGMHWRTYYDLRDKEEEANNLSLIHAAHW